MRLVKIELNVVAYEFNLLCLIMHLTSSFL